ncbi:PLP-dependent aminotransferase family protein [Pseudomonas izuensis]|uniref:PLP-dependent aminotransferase family protein n=1 Tax=Pseudomonas izuensis TaxID=2684212 RepID=A0ABM7S358_9PSED|nr:PLP-dependent aminotransferase family protein [Pseudomonas izuensis]BCX69022.1 PLP-dependent aminotransferase family protein [Pseudomonas izuensis]
MGQFSTESNASSRGTERRIYARLRAQIEDGTLAAGAKLVSTRAMAAELGVSRTTVTAVYEQLAAEGFVVTSAGKAARVARGMSTPSGAVKADSQSSRKLPPALSSYGQRVAALEPYSVASPLARIDFKYGSVASRDFPALGWQRAYRAELVKRQANLYYGQPEGEERLRSALQGYLRRARGLVCDVEQILVVHGSQQGVDLCARLLLDPQDAFAFEEPGYRMARYSFEATGATALPIPVDAAGLDTRHLPDDDRVRLAYVTPSHQFPMGAVLSIARRQELLRWASRHRAWIIEDDYGGEFRYGQRPIDALQSMDTDARVIYVGTFSKALSPQLRLGYLVLPRELVHVFREAKRMTDRHSARWEQNVLASLIESGTYERHVRRLRRENERRRKALLEAVEQHLAGQGQLVGMAAGLHGVLLLPALRAVAELALQASALKRGVGVYPLAPLFAGTGSSACERPAGLILGYAGLTTREIDEGVGILAEVIRDLIGGLSKARVELTPIRR